MSEEVNAKANPGDIICGIKAALTALECKYQMDLLEEVARRQKEKKSAASPPMFMMIPIEQKKNGAECDKAGKKRKNRNIDCEDSASSIGSTDLRRPTDRRRSGCDENKGPSLRGGVLYTRCGCIHRDGLQDSCPLTDCRGQPECMTKPWATCPPAKYFRARYPDIYPPSAAESITF